MDGKAQLIHGHVRAESHSQIVDLEKRTHPTSSRSRGFNASVSPSPTRFSATTVKVSANPGQCGQIPGCAQQAAPVADHASPTHGVRVGQAPGMQEMRP